MYLSTTARLINTYRNNEYAPWVKMPKTGLTLVNFCIPKSINFDNGMYLKSCSPLRMERIGFNATKVLHKENRTFGDFRVSVSMNEFAFDDLEFLHQDRRVGIIIVPILMMKALVKHQKDKYTKLRHLFPIQYAEYYSDKFVIPE